MPLIPEPALTASEQVAAAIVDTMIERVNGALAAFIQALVWSLKKTWQPEGCTPQEVLAAMDTRGAALFAQSADAVAYLWADDARRTEFLAECAGQGLELTIVEGLPVFPARQATTSNPDGTVTLTN